MKKQGGFTLIELIVVIVILAILGVTAAPRFLNLQSDARKASLQGLKGAIQGAAGIVYGKAAVLGLETISAGKNVNVDGITIAYGYPTADIDGIVSALVGGNDGDWTISEAVATSAGAGTLGLVKFYFANNAQMTGDCYVQYEEAADKNTAPEVKIENDDC